MKKIIKRVVLPLLALVLVTFSVMCGIRIYNVSNTTTARELEVLEEARLKGALSVNYKDRYEVLKPLPYKTTEQNLDVWAESVILINADNGNILYERNADEVIPPASMTKLFAMYVVDEEVSSGRLSYDQIIPLPEESLACNMPPRSSLMFLGEGQKVTLEELLLGLSIASGNDAAYALAYTVCGSMEEFVERMNKVARDLGLVNTHFVESSGYSELNTTTAREMAKFSAIYLEKHPDSLKRFHSVREFTYPKEHNLAEGDILEAQDFSTGLPRHITMSITQENTNPLLGVLEGCDGLKTGYIDESGYNLSLTASRDGTRYISITMKGPGSNSIEGQKGRVHDGTLLMEWAFSRFSNMDLSQYFKPYPVKSLNASEIMINLVPAFDEIDFTIPCLSGKTKEENLNNIKVIVEVPDYTWGEIEMGEELGVIKVLLEDYILDEIPLVSDRKLIKNNFIVGFADKIHLFFN